MAASATPNANHNTRYTVYAAAHGGLNIQEGTYTPSTTYTTGGDAVTWPGGAPDIVLTMPVSGYSMYWDKTNEKMIVYVAAGTETTAATDLGTATLADTPYVSIKWGGK